jgi:2-methylaconitate cis-trans-isomerase PrpF
MGLTAALVVSQMTGCVAAAVVGAGAVTYAYVEGDTEGYLRKTPDEVEQAARTVLTQAGVRTVDKRVSEQGRIELDGETETGTNIRVVIKPKPEATYASVRVGLVGNNAASGALFKKLREELGIVE